MYREFGVVRSWKRILIPAVVLLGGFSLPVSVLVILVVLKSSTFTTWIAALLMIAAALGFPLRHLWNLYTLPQVELDDHFLVANEVFRNRRVLTMSRISRIRVCRGAVFLIHNGFPLLPNLQSLNDEDRAEVLRVLSSAVPDQAFCPCEPRRTL